MRRPIKIVLLALGTVLGYGFAIHSMRYHRHYGYGYGQDDWCDHRGHGWAPDRPPSPAPAPAPQPPQTPQ
jgi:hypothetical protein